VGVEASWEGSANVEAVTWTPYMRFQHPPESQMLFTYITVDINREVRHIRSSHCTSNGSWNLCTKSETVNKTSFLIKISFVFVTVAYSRLTLFEKKKTMNCTIFKYKASSMLLILSVDHPGVFTKLNKMVFTSQTHTPFIVVLNVLFGQHVSTGYWVIIRPLHKNTDP
jgi:hypothetical protein